MPKPYWTYQTADDGERIQTLAADEVTAPSQAIVEVVQPIWKLPADIIALVPNVFIASQRFLEISPLTNTGRITFLGRLEGRKGVIDLVEAIPIVMRAAPLAKFRFVGRSWPHPATGEDFRAYTMRILGRYSRAVEFVDAVPNSEIPKYLSETDICVFPSLWENFPNVCLEAMAAARGVVGSSSGGMAEIISDDHTGLLVPPRSPKAIAAALLKLLRDPDKRIAVGRAARAHVISAYSPEVIGALQEASYARAIARARRRVQGQDA